MTMRLKDIHITFERRQADDSIKRRYIKLGIHRWTPGAFLRRDDGGNPHLLIGFGWFSFESWADVLKPVSYTNCAGETRFTWERDPVDNYAKRGQVWWRNR